MVQEESFTGVLAWVMVEWGSVGWRVKGLFEAFNEEVKKPVKRKCYLAGMVGCAVHVGEW